ncbi:Gpi1-domain-containing protein [Phellopilus nigrolimitatus]|nr:Gpi1-domain-containing protein [Phellopilus nigrolimitatus]
MSYGKSIYFRRTFILYKRPKHHSKQHYSLDSVDLDLMLAIQPFEENTPLNSQLSAFRTSQAALVKQRSPIPTGINATVLEQANTAHELMVLLVNLKDSDELSSFDKKDMTSVSSWIKTNSLIQRIYRTIRNLLCLFGETFAYIWNFSRLSRPVLASAQQIDLRCEQIAFIRQQLQILRSADGPCNNINSAQYISTQNCIWLILNDIIVGSAVGVFLIENRKSIAKAAYYLSKLCTATLIRSTIHWLDNWPAGLKLNTELSHFLFLIFNSLIDMWEAALQGVEHLFPTIILIYGSSGVFGLTMILTLLSDLTSFLTVHLSVSYLTVRMAFKNQLMMLNSLFNLFRGKRYNVLRCRLDDWSYDLDQLLLGAMLFTLVSFLFPTIAAYYVLFALSRLAVIILQAGFEVALALLNHFPLFALTLRVKDPWRLPGGITFFSFRDPVSNRTYFTMQNSSVPFSRIFSQYTVLGSRLGTYYSPSRLVAKLFKGDRLDPIPQHWIRYTYGSQRRVD